MLLHRVFRRRQHASEIDLLEVSRGRPAEAGLPGGGRADGGILTFTAGLADKATGSTLPSMFPDAIGMTLREPFGVCGSIIPWNAPGPNTVNDAGPAIAMEHHRHQARRGCAVAWRRAWSLVWLALTRGYRPG